jgi:hypothetical protein
MLNLTPYQWLMLATVSVFIGFLVFFLTVFFEIRLIVGVFILLFLLFVGYLCFIIPPRFKWILSGAYSVMSHPFATFIFVTLVTLTMLATSGAFERQLLIIGLVVLSSWLVLFPQFVKRRFGLTLHRMFDLGETPYVSIGVLLFGASLVMQYFLIEKG